MTLPDADSLAIIALISASSFWLTTTFEGGAGWGVIVCCGTCFGLSTAAGPGTTTNRSKALRIAAVASLVTNAVYALAMFADMHGKLREVRVARRDHRAVEQIPVQQRHGVDCEGKVGGIVLLAAAGRQHGHQVMLGYRIGPTLKALCIAIAACDRGLSEASAVIQIELKAARRHVLGVDEQCYPDLACHVWNPGFDAHAT